MNAVGSQYREPFERHIYHSHQRADMHYGMWIAGECVHTEHVRNITSPADGEFIAGVAHGGIEHAKLAVERARQFFDAGGWRDESGEMRRDVLLGCAELLREHREHLAVLEAKNNGMPIGSARAEVDACCRYLEHFAALCTLPPEAPCEQDERSIIRYEPVGVVAAILPWNLPLLMAAWKLAPSIAAGNATILKPSSLTPLTALELAGLLYEAGCPPRALSVLTGGGGSVGEYLASSDGVDKLSFTGSTEVGRRVMQLASKNLKRLTLECGGKGANIVLEDADIEKAVRGAVHAIFYNCGQACTAGSRLLLPSHMHDDFMERLLDATERLRVGHPLSDPDMGAIASRAQLEKIERYVELGIEEGATLVCGGRRLTDGECSRGLYFSPTIFTDVEVHMRIAQEEIFGPVLCVLTYDGEDEAVRIANSTIYGLASGIWSEDRERALSLARRLRCGTVWINTYHAVPPYAPFGGYKQSGIGREHGIMGLREYQEVKHILLR
ncbi:aldehyde dehydrogenase family protein [Methermicoccus shengliensis]|uniref:Aldehyde dehydrogenase n=1 Tax=Methermicoccus shengliensis TaxID=660064 RepID=A0A832RXV0_9EURY|nr:aldehyde dehydrogenase family protein [Methermicoccus shengliensis]HIH69942.1 aldehyde dehydrogenase [Methermicoccus shengliensis]